MLPFTTINLPQRIEIGGHTSDAQRTRRAQPPTNKLMVQWQAGKQGKTPKLDQPCSTSDGQMAICTSHTTVPYLVGLYVKIAWLLFCAQPTMPLPPGSKMAIHVTQRVAGCLFSSNHTWKLTTMATANSKDRGKDRGKDSSKDNGKDNGKDNDKGNGKGNGNGRDNGKDNGNGYWPVPSTG